MTPEPEPEPEQTAGVIAWWDRQGIVVQVIIAAVTAAIAVALLVIFWHWCLRLAFHVTGSDNESGAWYGLWSGFGGRSPTS